MHSLHELLTRFNLEDLVTFVAVAEHSSFSDAANAIGRDPTIVSRRVTRLEKNLGVRLLSRTTRKVALTEAGSQYYRRVRGVLDELDNAGTEASNLATTPQGLLRVSLPITFGRQWIAPYSLRFFPNTHRSESMRSSVTVTWIWWRRALMWQSESGHSVTVRSPLNTSPLSKARSSRRLATLQITVSRKPRLTSVTTPA